MVVGVGVVDKGVVVDGVVNVNICVVVGIFGDGVNVDGMLVWKEQMQ